MDFYNIFTGKIVDDLDKSKIPQDSWVFPTLNMRVMNKDGQGLIMTNIRGNEFDLTNNVGIQLSSGFIAIGVCEHKGIGYIVSYNPTTTEGEIGCYPSPRSLDASTPATVVSEDFTAEYRPLKNFTATDPFGIEDSITRVVFRTTEFNFDLEHQVKVIARDDYDDTVNLYLCDYKNYNRVINTGFNQDGEVKNRLYWSDSFPNYVSHIPLANSIPAFGSLSLEEGGKWKSGNTFLYFRYSTESFVRTSFLTEAGPIQISEGTPVNSNYDRVQGVTGISLNDKDVTKKTIKFTLSNLDTNYKYIEVACVRYFSGEDGVVVWESKLIDKRYNITGTSTDFILTGNETFLNITDAEIITPTIKDLISKDHTQTKNIYWGVNYKRSSYHNDILSDYASRIIPEYYDAGTILKTVGYKNFENAFDMVGHFRGEPYPFGVVFVFNGGIHSDVYPIAGKDDYAGTGINANTDGIYRFPNISVSPLLTGSNMNIMGIKFNNIAAKANLIGDDLTWWNENIIGFYYVRGDRHKNLLYQGITMYGCRSYIADATGVNNSYPIIEQITENGGGFSLPNKNSHVPYGCASILDDLGGSGLPADFVGIIEKPAGTFATWCGFTHIKYAENQAESSMWGANRGDLEMHVEGGGEWGTDTYANDKEYVMPIYKGFYPITYKLYKEVGDDKRSRIRHSHTRCYYIHRKYGFFSPDYILDEFSKAPESGVLEKFYKVRFSEDINGGSRSQITYSDYDCSIYPWWTLASIYSYTSYNQQISVSKFTDVEKHKKLGSSGEWISEYTDAGYRDAMPYQTDTCMTYWSKINNSDGRYQIASNRSMSTAKYIGINTTGTIADLNLSLCNIYVTQPSISDTITDFFDTYNINYKKISPLINSSSVPDLSNAYYNGDCFLQRSFFKQMAWNGSSSVDGVNPLNGSQKDNRDDDTLLIGTGLDHQKLVNVGHGLTMEFITENAINTDMRFNEEDRTYYPKNSSSRSFALLPDNDKFTEATLINKGYNITTGLKPYLRFNDKLPYIDTVAETRVRYSDEYISGSFIDSYRTIMEASYKDFNTANGPINGVATLYDSLITFQESAINEHYIERQKTTTTDEGEIVIGTGDILSKECRKLSDYGTQHQWSIISTRSAIYCVDRLERAIIRVGINTNDQGKSYLGAENISRSYLIQKTLYDILESFTVRTDKMNILKDTPVNGEGICVGYDPMYNDVLFTFIDSTTRRTLVFNEDINGFVGEYSFTSPMYLSINKDFYSVNRLNQRQIYKHNIEDDTNHNTFYGVNYGWKLSVVPNGNTQQRNSSEYMKQYNGIVIEMPEENLYNVLYETEYQSGTYDNFDPDDTRFWLAPLYKENRWHLPVMVQDSAINNQYNPESQMKGKWMKITLESNLANRIFVKGINTLFTLSQV